MIDTWERIHDAALTRHKDGGAELARLVIEADDPFQALTTRVAELEAKREEYHQIANAYATWVGDVGELLENRRNEIDQDRPSDARLLFLLDQAEKGIAKVIRAALNEKTPAQS